MNELLTFIKNAKKSNKLANTYLIYGENSTQIEQFSCQLIKILTQKEEDSFTLDNTPIMQDITKTISSCYELKAKSISNTITYEQLNNFQNNFHTTSPNLKIGIIYNADTMSPRSQNNLLKTLEEPPKNTLFILLTTKKNKLLSTIISRCQQIYLAGDANEEQQPLFQSISQIFEPLFLKKGLKNALDVAGKYFDFIESTKKEIEKSASKEDAKIILKQKQQKIEDLLLLFFQKKALYSFKEKYNLTEEYASNFDYNFLLEKAYQCHKDLQSNMNKKLIINNFLIQICIK